MEQGLAERRKEYLVSMQNELPQEVRDMLNTIDLLTTKVGCKPFDASDEDEILIIEIARFVVAGYKGMTAAEVVKAFDLAAQRKLVFEGKTVNLSTYAQKLSANLVGLVLTAYVTHCNALRAQAAGYVERQPKRIDHEPIRMTPQQAYDMLVQMCGEEKVIPQIFGPWATVYEHLLEADLITDWSEDKIKGIRDDAKKKLTRGVAISRMDRIGEDSIDRAMKELSVIRYLEEQGFSLTTKSKQP